ncbi:hypothetical protein PV11_02489 [Exophiala sideris]|uniref:Protein phosphatase n=1 Tax=Exophiala sideris TaxID=1016849 RepID=A0A0D1ZJD0_9EURO|nr:hypothetical protein PV11_02489 [Exophiala sideris]
MLAQAARSSRHAVAHSRPRILRLLGGCVPQRSILSDNRRFSPSSSSFPRDRLIDLRTFSATTARYRTRYLISEGRTTNPTKDDNTSSPPPPSPFYFETGYSIFAKRPSRPFPPPFVSPPSGSFSEPLTTHNQPRGRRPYVNGQPLRGVTNGDDAIIIGDSNFIAVDDGVGAWAQKERGHAALWSRLIAHFWAIEVEKSFQQEDVDITDLDPIQSLQEAYVQTKAATKGTLKDEDVAKDDREPAKPPPDNKDGEPKVEPPGENDILGTTTASSALLHYKTSGSSPQPVILATTLGDCKVLVVRPSDKSVLYRSKEQWHWFDCPRQLGTNSPDTPLDNAVTDTVDIELGDVVAVLSDGVTDNLWEHEICETISQCVEKWTAGEDEAKDGIVYVARTLMNAAREVAEDPNAESPYMERAFDEGIAAEGGKLDDISVVLGICRKKE